MKFENQIFTSDITLDFNEFHNCTIKNCAIIFHGYPHLLVDTQLESVRFVLGSAANTTLQFLKTLREQDPNLVEDLFKNAGNVPPALPPGTKAN